MKRLLILGGTGEAAQLAAQAAALPLSIISSLAGRTQHPISPSGMVRLGGFGGISGLTSYLQEAQIDLMIDATHPFAVQISAHAIAASIATRIPLLRMVRPVWQPIAGDRWIEVDSLSAAAATLPKLGRRIFLTIGRQELAAFSQVPDCWFLMRMIDPPAPDVTIPPGEIVLARGPFSLEMERSLLTQYQIDVIVSKNSGGRATYAKIEAARTLERPVVMVGRSRFEGVEAGGEQGWEKRYETGYETVADVTGAIAWLRGHSSDSKNQIQGG